MHELSIALSIVDGALEELRRHDSAQATAVHLRLGRLAGVDKEALLFSYGVACAETPLASSRLIVEDIDVTVHCPKCGAERAIQSFPLLLCPECGSFCDRIVHGNELEITAMEIVN